MFSGLSRFIYRFRFAIVVFWLAAVVAATVWLPSLSNIVAHTKTTFVPNSSEFVQAQNLANEIDTKHQSASSAVVAIHNSKGLTSADKSYFQKHLSTLGNEKSKYGISSVTDEYNTDKSLKKEFVSSDGTTEIALIGFPNGSVDQATSDSLQKVQNYMTNAPAGSAVEFTGDVPIQQDNVRISMSGVKKTAFVTVALVLLILLIVFRSVIAPFVTLVSIGVSFMLTQSLVAWLAQFGLPVSTFTQTFLVAVLFGAGTDYSIIIMNRFREELMKEHGDITSAMTASMKAIGKTVFYSGLTVLVSFAVLYFARFGLYRTAVGVSVGVAITILVCFTFIPALMAILGRHLFWPRRPVVGGQHAQSRIWGFSGRVSTRHPWLTLLVLIVLLVPTALLFTNERTFDPMSDIPQAPSVKGFHVLSKAFSPGKVMPTTIVLHTSKNLRTPSGLATIQTISQALAKEKGVSQVDSATRPTGKEVTDFQLANQNGQAATGLKKVNNGISSEASGLSTTASKLKSGESGVNQLASGAKQVSSGTSQLSQGLNSAASNTTQLVNGAQQLADGSQKLNQGLNTYVNSVGQINQGATGLLDGLKQYQAGADSLGANLDQFAQGQSQLAQGASGLVTSIKGLIQANTGNTALENQLNQLLQAAEAESNGLTSSATSAQQLSSGLDAANKNLPSLVSGATMLQQGTSQLAAGGKQLTQATQGVAKGATQVSQGTAALSSGLNQMASASSKLTSGSQQVAGGLQSFASQYAQLPNGLSKAASGLNSIGSGVGKVQNYLSDSKVAATTGKPGFYVPKSTVQSNADLKKSMDAYISTNGHVAKFTVVLDANPYSNKAINQIPQLEQTALAALHTSPIHSGAILASGTTAQQATMNQISSSDFVRTVILILSAIFLLLVVMLRSIVTPLYIIGSLASTYFVTMGILQEIFVNILGKPGLSWVVPFFAFLLLVALGVDYSIFLMTRFEEEYEKLQSFPAAIRAAMRNMGNVVFSAALIMAGTFGSMAVAGVTSLVEIGTSVVIGLGIYSLVILAFFIPACATVINVGHLWPFKKNDDVMESNESSLPSASV